MTATAQICSPQTTTGMGVTLGLRGDRPVTVPAMPRPRRNLVNTVMSTWVQKNLSFFCMGGQLQQNLRYLALYIQESSINHKLRSPLSFTVPLTRSSTVNRIIWVCMMMTTEQKMWQGGQDNISSDELQCWVCP
jgi:hypothetical protein